MVFRKLISLLLLFTILFAVSSPVFASSDAVRYSASAYYPRPSADEFSGYVSFIDSNNNLYTYCWRFFPYEGLVETSNVSPRMDVYYNSSDGKLYFNGYTGLSEQTSIVIYRYYSSSSSTSPSVTLMLSDSFPISREYAVSSVAPVAVSFGGNVDYGFPNTPYNSLNITFAEDSNSDYNVELFYNYYKNMMDILYPAITAAFADINNIDLSVDNIESYSQAISSMVTSIINLLNSQLQGSGDGSLSNPFTIRDFLSFIEDNTDNIESLLTSISNNTLTDSDLDLLESLLTSISSNILTDSDLDDIESLLTSISNNTLTDSDLDQIESLLTTISDVDLSDIKSLLTSISDEDLSAILSTLNDISTRCNYLVGIYNSVSNPAMANGVLRYINNLNSRVASIQTFLADGNSYSSFPELLESTLSVLNSDFYEAYLKDHFSRQESFYEKAEAFFDAYNSSQSDERLDYDDSKNNSWNIFAIFNRVVLKPFSSFWDQISSVFVFDSGSLSSDSVISDYLFYSSGLPGFNNLSDVDWSTLP